MTSITVRNIPDEEMRIIKTLSNLAKRSINNEILTLIEKGLGDELKKIKKENNYISRDTQIKIWSRVSKQWVDNRSTKDIINDIYKSRTKGRDINL
jgi:hypothetical protein